MPGRLRLPAWVGMLPFMLFVGIFLGLPLYVVIHGAFTTENNQLTLSNFQQLFTQSQYTIALKNSLILALWTSIIPAILGLWLAAAMVAGKSTGVLTRTITSMAPVFAYYGGVPLAFLWLASFGPLGVLTVIIHDVTGYQLTDHISYDGMLAIGFVYFYFQIPLMIIWIRPALEGLRTEWEEAARNLGATRFQYLRLVALPVLAPSLIGTTLLLFGSAFAAFATAYALDGGTLPIVPGRINLALSNNVLPGQTQIAMALGTEMIAVVLLVMVGYWLVQKRAGRWLPR